MGTLTASNPNKPGSVTSKKGILKKSPSTSVSNVNSVKKSKSSLLHNSPTKAMDRKADSRLSHDRSLHNIEDRNRSTNTGTSTSMTLTSLGKGLTKSLADAMGQIGAGL